MKKGMSYASIIVWIILGILVVTLIPRLFVPMATKGTDQALDGVKDALKDADVKTVTSTTQGGTGPPVLEYEFEGEKHNLIYALAGELNACYYDSKRAEGAFKKCSVVNLKSPTTVSIGKDEVSNIMQIDSPGAAYALRPGWGIYKDGTQTPLQTNRKYYICSGYSNSLAMLMVAIAPTQEQCNKEILGGVAPVMMIGPI